MQERALAVRARSSWPPAKKKIISLLHTQTCIPPALFLSSLTLSLADSVCLSISLFSL